MIKRSIFGFTLCFVLLFFSGKAYATEYNYNTEVFHEDFNYYNVETMQKSNWPNGGAFDCYFSPNNITFSNGIMKLKLNDTPIGGYKYAGAEYQTKDIFGYGSYRVSMKPIKNDGVVSSFFIYTGPAMGTQWDEIDIEFLGKDTTKVQFGFFTNGVVNGVHLYNLGFDASESFHEYGFDWSEEAITWYVDGKAVYQVTSEQCKLPSIPGKIIMNVWNGRTEDTKYWLNEYDGTTPLTAEYNYISYRPFAEEIPTEQQNGTVSPKNWKTDSTPEQFTLESIYGVLRVTRTPEQNMENAFFIGDLSETVTNPTKLNMKLKFLNGNKRIMTVYLVDTKNNSTKVLEINYPRTDYEEHTIEVPLEGIEGEISQVKIFLNSEPDKLNVKKESRCKAYIMDVSVSN